MHTSGLIFRTTDVTRWGAGKGADLTPAEVDLNFYDLDERVVTIELNPPTPIEISEITVTGSSMTVHMADSSTFGPFTLPTAPARVWLTGSGAPAAELGEEGDLYLDTVGGDVSQHQGTTGWVQIDNLTGPIGAAGAAGADGTIVTSLDDVPDVDYTTAGPAEGDVLVRRSSLWVHEPGVGRQTLWVPAAAMQPTVTAGAGDHNSAGGLATVELTAGRPNITYLPYDSVAEQNAGFSVAMPKSWNLGDLVFQTIYSHAGGQTGGLDGVAWGLKAVAVGDGESVDAVFGTEIAVTKDASAADAEHKTAESAAVTAAGSIAAGDTVYFNLARKVDDAADDLDLEARLHGLKLFYTTNALTDD